jgi:hypothetical protein
VHQVGQLPELYEDARSEIYNILWGKTYSALKLSIRIILFIFCWRNVTWCNINSLTESDLAYCTGLSVAIVHNLVQNETEVVPCNYPGREWIVLRKETFSLHIQIKRKRVANWRGVQKFIRAKRLNTGLSNWLTARTLKTDIITFDPVNERCLILEWYLISNVLGAFEKCLTATISFVMSVCLSGWLSARPSVRANSSPTENICTKFDIWEFFENL